MKRKFFSILTALALCLTLLPTAVWAEEADAAVQEEGHTHYLCGGDTWAIPAQRRPPLLRGRPITACRKQASTI